MTGHLYLRILLKLLPPRPSLYNTRTYNLSCSTRSINCGFLGNQNQQFLGNSRRKNFKYERSVVEERFYLRLYYYVMMPPLRQNCW